MGSEATSKLSPALAAEFGSADDHEEIHVAVSVESEPAAADPTESRVERLRARQQRFDERAQPVVAAIRSLGGTVDTIGWANATVYATIAKSAVPGLEQLDEVRDIDVAVRLET